MDRYCGQANTVSRRLHIPLKQQPDGGHSANGFGTKRVKGAGGAGQGLLAHIDPQNSWRALAPTASSAPLSQAGEGARCTQLRN
ncbi:hypothetical protein GCM10017620_30010 [Brevundimonas intermedia]|uniref:Uncharacterized protein n=1 Tax=Brevundimonas intermedia TaxID=74315 RepID=A0ABQ5TC82_9CAUL|nr:hypothetical protein GCM10017620_30010 [Brevundimonas intermedia]